MLLTSFFQKITCSNGAKSLTTVHKSNNIWKKKDFAMEHHFLVQLHHLPITLVSLKKTPLRPYNSVIIRAIFSWWMLCCYYYCMCDL